MYGGEVENHQLLQGEAIVGLPMMMNNNNIYHVPWQSRREKLRYPNSQESLPSTEATTSALHHCQHNLKTNFSNPHFTMPFSSMLPKAHNNQHISEPAPTEAFTGYAAVLQASRFLVPTKHMLEEICDVGVGRHHRLHDDVGGLNGVKGKPPLDDWQVVVDQLKVAGMNWGNTDGKDGDEQRMKTWLISTLTEVYKIYKQYFDQIRAVIASFESIPGLLNAAPYASMAMKSLSSYFSGIKDAIFNQLRLTTKPSSKEEKVHLGVVDGGVFCRRQSTQAVGNGQHRHVWRPQRGLPEHAVSVLKAWLFEHFLHPYPTDADKHMLTQQTGLSRNQVSNWFINARVRLWKPMVEEVHYLEQRQIRKSKNPDPLPTILPLSSRVNTSNLATDKQMPLSSAEKAQESMIRPADPSHPQQPTPTFVGGGAISLTLGLQQNNEICFLDSIPLNVSRQFGFEEGSVSCITSRSGDRGLCVGKEMNQQFIRDYVG